MITVDARRNKKATHYGIPKYLCSALCKKCGWRGWRKVKVKIDLDKNFERRSADELIVNDLVKGMASERTCPKCGGSCVFTHTALRTR